MRLILVRHGESEGNASGVIQGRLDFGLTARGQAQAAATAERLATAGATALWSSPLRRARETADVIAVALGLAVLDEPDLQEYDVGVASGLTGPQINERYPEIVAAWRKGIRPVFPGEEGRDVFARRVAAVLDRAQADGGTIVAVTHGGVSSAICASLVGIDTKRLGAFEMANCAITEVGLDRQGRRVLFRQNDTCHLEALGDEFVSVVDRG